MLDLVLRPGDPKKGKAADAEDLTAPAWMLYGNGFGSFEGSAGATAIPWLIPGGRYALRLQERLGWPIKKVFTPPPSPSSEVLQLGSVAITPRPPRKP